LIGSIGSLLLLILLPILPNIPFFPARKKLSVAGFTTCAFTICVLNSKKKKEDHMNEMNLSIESIQLFITVKIKTTTASSFIHFLLP
jgi:hypothetical protein